MLVQGCWVVKSGLIYPEGNNDAVRKCRDSILSHFNQHTRLTANSLRKDLTREVPPALLDSVLFQVVSTSIHQCRFLAYTLFSFLNPKP